MYQASKWLFLSASYLVLLLNSGDFDKGDGYCALIIAHLLPLLACISACQPTGLLLSSHSSRTFQILARFDPDVSHVLRSNGSPLFPLLYAAPSPRFIGHLSARRASMHPSPHLLVSELGENHTAPYCPQASAARQHRSPSHQADNTLVLCQQLDTEICHGQRCTTIDSTDWSGTHSWLWHRPTACYWIAVPPPTIFLFSHKAPNSAINATRFNRTSICPKERRGGIRVSQS